MTGIGRMLIEAREAQRITLEQVERDTRIVRRYLEALEREDFAAFPFEVYARGFLRSYASYLHLNGDALVALMPGSPDQPDTRPAGRISQPRRESKGPVRPRPPEPRQPARQPARASQPDPPDGQHRPAGGRARPSPAPGRTQAPSARAPEPPSSPGATARTTAAVGQVQPAGSPLRLAGVAGAILGTALLIGIVASRCSDSSIGGPAGAPGAGPVAATRTTPGAGPTAIAGRMPDLRGAEETSALAQLTALGVAPFVIELPSRDVAAGQVIRQSPEPGKTIGETTVTVVISRGG